MSVARRATPPRDLDDLRARAGWLAGRRLDELSRWLAFPLGASSLRGKGKAGELVERALGASGRAGREHDFPALGVELKTIPVGDDGRPRETTFVCALPLVGAEDAEWSSSWARAKLAHVLWVPVEGEGEERRLGVPFFWRPAPDEEAILRGDYEEILGMLATGRVEALTAHVGTWLQARPKAAHGRVRTIAYNEEGAPIAATPRGLYLRVQCTARLLAKARTLGVAVPTASASE